MYVCKCVCAHVLCVLIGQNEPIFFFSFPGHRLRKLMRQFSEVEPFIANLILTPWVRHLLLPPLRRLDYWKDGTRLEITRKQRKGGLIDKKNTGISKNKLVCNSNLVRISKSQGVTVCCAGTHRNVYGVPQM